MPGRRLLKFLPLLLIPVLISILWRTPPATDPELVTLTAATDRSALRAGEAAQVVVRLQLAAEEREAGDPVAMNLGLLLDTSGSMAGEPIEHARAAVHALIGELRPDDRLTIVTFDSRTQVVLPPTLIDDADLDEVAERVDAIQAQGTTDLAAGLGTLLGQLQSNPTVGDLDRIVIVSDGVPNDATPLAGQVELARQLGFAITTLGVGLDYDEVLLGDMARNSGGRFHHVEDEALADSVVAEVFGAQRQVAGSVSLYLSAGPGVTITRVIGSSPTMTGVHGYSVVLGELSEGEAQEVFVELDVAPPKAGTTLELLDAIVQFDDRAAGSGLLERRAFIAMPVSDDKAVLAMRAPDVELGVAGARAAAATIDAIAMARVGNYDGADQLLLDNDAALRAAEDNNAPDGPPKAKVQRQREVMSELRTGLADEQSKGGKGSGGETSGMYWRHAAKAANANSVDMLQAH
jgi:Ca-activated chloride channel family protein